MKYTAGFNTANPTILIALLLTTTFMACTHDDAAFKPELVEAGIIPVEEWGGERVDVTAAQHHEIRYITLHHGGVSFADTADAAAYLRNLQNWSRDERDWVDLPYHYLIDPQGRIYEGRNVMIPGDTNTDYDPAGHALICVLGNFELAEPNQAQLDAVTSLMALMAHRFGLGTDVIAGHKDYASNTVCPGENLYPYLENGYFRERLLELGFPR
jgi:hypothetical protein